jgi:hypothetical protein
MPTGNRLQEVGMDINIKSCRVHQIRKELDHCSFEAQPTKTERTECQGSTSQIAARQKDLTPNYHHHSPTKPQLDKDKGENILRSRKRDYYQEKHHRRRTQAIHLCLYQRLSSALVDVALL